MKRCNIILLLIITSAIRADDPVQGGKNVTAFAVDTEITYVAAIEKISAGLSQWKSRYLWSDYLKVLDELADKKRYLVCTGLQFLETNEPEKIVVYLRHDIDHDPITALKMVKEEKKRDICASYYILPTAPYYGTQTETGVRRYACMDELYRQLMSGGNEIGIHNNLLTMMLQWDIEPMVFQKQELEYYHTAGFPVTGVVSHGSWINKLNINNTWIFSEFKKKGSYVYKGKSYEYGKYSLSDFGFCYEGYLLKCNKRLSDISGYPTGAVIVEKLRSCVPGDKVSLLIHPCHWRSDKD